MNQAYYVFKFLPFFLITVYNMYILIVILFMSFQGRRRYFWGKESLKPEWWPKNCPFSNVRNRKNDFLVKILTSYTDSQKQVAENINIRDRSPISSPKRSILEDDVIFTDDIVTSSDEHNEVLESVDLEFFSKEPVSISDDSNDSITPPSEPSCFFPKIPDTPAKSVMRGESNYALEYV